MKTIRKIIPVSLYDIPGVERWLEKQANLGLFPIRLGSWAVFRPGGVPGTRFRLDAFSNRMGEGTEPTPEKLELYRAAGWEYIGPIGRAYFLFYTTDPQAPELYTDYGSRGLSLDRLARQVQRAKWSQLLFPVLLLVLLLAVLLWPAGRYDVQPDRWARLPLVLLHLFQPMLLLFWALLCYRAPINLRDYRTLLRTHDALKAGLPPPPSPGPSREIVRENIAALLLTPVLLLALVGGWALDRTIPAEDFSQPYVSLAGVEQEPVATYEELFGESSSFDNERNQAKRQFSLLAPVWYEVKQRRYSLEGGAQPNAFSPDPEGGKYRYSPSLDMTAFHLSVPALARPVAKAQMDLYRLVNLRWAYEEMEYPGTDFVILARPEEGIWQMAAVSKGGRVAVFRYAGQEDLAQHLDMLIQMVQ